MEQESPAALTRRRVLAGAALVALTGLSASCGESAPKRRSRLDGLRERGVVRVGVADEPPFGYVTDDGAVTGLGPQVARAAFARLGVPRIEGAIEAFDQLIAGVNARRFDVIGAMMYVTPERCRDVAFATPIFVAPTALAVRAREERDLTDYPSLTRAGATLAVLAGAVERTDALAGGVPAARIRTFLDVASAQAALELGRVDAIALTAPSIRRIAHGTSGRVRAEPPFFPRKNGREIRRYGAHAFAAADTALRDAFDRAVADLRDSGELVRIARAQGFTDAEVDGAGDVTWKAACAG